MTTPEMRVCHTCHRHHLSGGDVCSWCQHAALSITASTGVALPIDVQRSIHLAQQMIAKQEGRQTTPDIECVHCAQGHDSPTWKGGTRTPPTRVPQRGRTGNGRPSAAQNARAIELAKIKAADETATRVRLAQEAHERRRNLQKQKEADEQQHLRDLETARSARMAEDVEAERKRRMLKEVASRQETIGTWVVTENSNGGIPMDLSRPVWEKGGW